MVETPGPLAEWKKEIGRIRALVAPKPSRTRAPQPPMTPAARAARARALALEAGFDLAGVACRGRARASSPSSREWIARGYAGEMALPDRAAREARRPARGLPLGALASCASACSTTRPAPTRPTRRADRGWIARYAWGDDYHDVMKALLRAPARARSRPSSAPCESRVYVDTGPIVERAYAAAAGLGAWGKNTCLLHPEHGSWFFLGEVVTDLDLEPDAPRPDMCGTCTACLDACPTGALVAPYVLDATRCISYLTIEVKGAIPEDRRDGVGRHVFGCDICQDVCPWNRRRRHDGEPGVRGARGAGRARSSTALAALDDEGLPRALPQEPGEARQAARACCATCAVALGNSGDAAHRPVLERLAADEDPIVREHAAWALDRLP